MKLEVSEKSEKKNGSAKKIPLPRKLVPIPVKRVAFDFESNARNLLRPIEQIAKSKPPTKRKESVT